MRYWIEVISGDWKWKRLLNSERGLEAPDSTRYKNYFEGMKIGDIVFHYLTTGMTRDKKKRSSIVGISIVSSNPHKAGKKITAKCIRTTEFIRPVKFKDIAETNIASSQLKKLIDINMQRYLTEISSNDFNLILNVYLENKMGLTNFHDEIHFMHIL